MNKGRNGLPHINFFLILVLVSFVVNWVQKEKYMGLFFSIFEWICGVLILEGFDAGGW